MTLNVFFTLMTLGSQGRLALGVTSRAAQGATACVSYLALSIGVVAGLMLANGALGGAFPALPLERLASWLPLGLRGTAMVAFGLTMSVLVLLTLVSEGGFRKGEISTVVPSFFAFYAFFFGMTYWLFA